ncbi:MAG TPA: hypothetical protein VMF89_34915 [Polyangiales bacterium]|nr:hypothetical protein [Polyangiales bacterium]
MQEQASTWVELGFVVLPIVVVGIGLWAVRRTAPDRFIVSTAVVTGWMALWGVLAAVGVLGRFELRPPPMAILIACTLAAGFWLGFSGLAGRVADGLPLWALVLVQGFRLPLELLMHQAAVERVMPNVLSYTGYNFDIVTGASAFVVAFALQRGAPRAIAFIWSCYGCLCLLAIAIIAVLSSPMVAYFGPHELNSWVTRLPFVWLPSVLVAFALAGHIVVFRKLRRA